MSIFTKKNGQLHSNNNFSGDLLQVVNEFKHFRVVINNDGSEKAQVEITVKQELEGQRALVNGKNQL